jgi:hypothetical protein
VFLELVEEPRHHPRPVGRIGLNAHGRRGEQPAGCTGRA